MTLEQLGTGLGARGVSEVTGGVGGRAKRSSEPRSADIAEIPLFVP